MHLIFFAFPDSDDSDDCLDFRGTPGRHATREPKYRQRCDVSTQYCLLNSCNPGQEV